MTLNPQESRARQPLVAIIDDDEALVRMICMLCETEGLDALPLPSDDGALPVLIATRPDVAIVDLWVSQRGSGLQLIHAIRTTPELDTMRVVVCSGDVQVLDDHKKEFAAFGCRLLPKPFAVEDLLILLQDSTVKGATG